MLADRCLSGISAQNRHLALFHDGATAWAWWLPPQVSRTAQIILQSRQPLAPHQPGQSSSPCLATHLCASAQKVDEHRNAKASSWPPPGRSAPAGLTALGFHCQKLFLAFRDNLFHIPLGKRDKKFPQKEICQAKKKECKLFFRHQPAGPFCQHSPACSSTWRGEA